MLKDWLVGDELFGYLLENSSLTEVQLDTLLSDLKGLTLKEKVRLRDKSVSKGSFVRTLKQAKCNVRSSIFTLLLLGYMGYLGEDDIVTMVKLVELVKRARGRKGVIKLLGEIINRFIK